MLRAGPRQANVKSSTASPNRPASMRGPIHPKAMPVILLTPEEIAVWLEADIGDAVALQRPLPDDALRIVAKGEKEDKFPEVAL